MPAVSARLVLSSTAVAAALAAGCGTSATSSSTCTPDAATAATPPRATSGPVTLAADRGAVPRGGTVAFTVTVTGPATVSAPCDAPVSLVVTDASDIHVYSASSPAQPGEPCGDLALGTGQTAVYQVRWDVDPTTPSGSYRVAASVGDLPDADVALAVSGAVPGAPAC